VRQIAAVAGCRVVGQGRPARARRRDLCPAASCTGADWLNVGAQREILGRLEHPNIARLYDAGVTPNGEPFPAWSSMVIGPTRRRAVASCLALMDEGRRRTQRPHRRRRPRVTLAASPEQIERRLLGGDRRHSLGVLTFELVAAGVPDLPRETAVRSRAIHTPNRPRQPGRAPWSGVALRAIRHHLRKALRKPAADR
jgi:hypothetical protein